MAQTQQTEEPRAPSREQPTGEERFWAGLEAAPLAAALVDERGQVVAGNAALERLIGHSEAELTETAIEDLVHPIDRPRVEHLLLKLAKDSHVWRKLDIRLFTAGGHLRWAQLSLFGFPARTSPAATALAIFEDVTQEREAEEALHRLSTTDELTGLLNRRGFHLLAEQAWRIARRKRRDMVLFFVDVDGLKEVNDSFGHAAGDRVLMETAAALREICREMDVVARLGGDEFVVLALEADESSIEPLRQRLEKDLQARRALLDLPYALSVSLGTSHFDPSAPRPVEELLAEADRRMYSHKQRRPRAVPSAGPAEAAPAPRAEGTVGTNGNGRLQGEVERLRYALAEIASLARASGEERDRVAQMQRRADQALRGE